VAEAAAPAGREHALHAAAVPRSLVIRALQASPQPRTDMACPHTYSVKVV